MASHKRLGIYWGSSGFSFVETVRDVPAMTAFVPFNEGQTAEHRAPSDDVDFLEMLQRTIRNKGFSTQETYLSLPSKDILIRWFLIPWVKTSEIQDVVAFESKKYIPFDLKETTYTYYPSTVAKDGVRQIGILFVAIRKESFDRYVNILTQSGLNVVYTEPGPMSLVRALVFKRLINVDQITAVLRTSADTGELVITTKGQVNFIRDFKIQTQGGMLSQESSDSDDILRARIFSEVRVSFEFFARQYGEEGVNRIIVLSSGLKQSFWTGLDEELGVTVNIIDPSREIFPIEGMNMGAVNAFGAAMSGNVSSVIDFNLSEGASQPVAQKKEESFRKHKQLILPLLAGIIAAAVIALAFYVSGGMINGLQSKILDASERVGVGASMSLEDIESKTALEQKKIEAIRSLPLSARAWPLMARLVKGLPGGVWLDDIAISFGDTGPAGSSAQPSVPSYVKVSTRAGISVSGYIYLNDNNAEFELANKLVNSMREDPSFVSLFGSIKLVTQRPDVYAGAKVTVFKIVCEAK